jgi:hypothetical protein
MKVLSFLALAMAIAMPSPVAGDEMTWGKLHDMWEAEQGVRALENVGGAGHRVLTGGVSGTVTFEGLVPGPLVGYCSLSGIVWPPSFIAPGFGLVGSNSAINFGTSVIDVPSGFDTAFSLRYVTENGAMATLSLYSEVSGGGVPLGSIPLPTTCPSADGCAPGAVGSVSFSGVAKSIVIQANGGYVLDDLTFGSTTPGTGGDACTMSGGADKDPHFKPWVGDWYDYMGACDMHLVMAPNFTSAHAMVIDIRTKIRREYSYIETAVVQIGSETFEVSSFGDYSLNGVSSAKLPGEISGFQVVYTQPNPNVHAFKILLGPNESILLTAFKDMVSVKIDEANADRFHGSLGMMGEFETGKLLGRDGKTVMKDPNALAAEWQVRSDEPMLFQTVVSPQHPQPCVLPAAGSSVSRRLGSSIALSAAEKACAKWSAETRENCVHDVMATGDLDLADAGAF